MKTSFPFVIIGLTLFLLNCRQSSIIESEKAEPFLLSHVRLTESRFTENMKRDLAYLEFLDSERMLYSWRRNYGLSTGTAKPLGGWEDTASGVRGQNMGHLLSALSFAYAATGENKYKNKAEYLIGELEKCQQRVSEMGYSEGYLSAFPEKEVDKLFLNQVPWAPLYCIHKIFAGMLDCYEYLGNEKALEIAGNLGNWTHNKLKAYNRDELQAAWNRMNWNSGEYGGFNESMAKLFKITGDTSYLETAMYFNHDFLFEPLKMGIDSLGGLTVEGRDGMHANTQFPKIIGAVEIFGCNNDSSYYHLASNFFDMVVLDHSYATGGNSIGERFKPAGEIGTWLGDNTTETCNTYNMLKLAGRLFKHDPSSFYMNFYERGLYNHILGSQDPESEHNHVTYFVPLRKGGEKTYTDDYNSFYCCHATGMENHVKYGSDIYYHNQERLYINLFIPSVLTWKEKNLVIRQKNNFPKEDKVTILIEEGKGRFEMAIREPAWLAGEMKILVNGKPENGKKDNGYVLIKKRWNPGDNIEVSLPMELWIEYTPDIHDFGAVFYGPILLAATGNNLSDTLTVDDTNLSETLVRNGAELEFHAVDRVFKAFYDVHHETYTVYFHVREK
ncbi:MAG: glycoside hydrolase family 127 protein [Bacteroidales bacterium]|nr:glycoside hydrolase family 127 protein [Bacteroidales bacterium]